MPLISSDLMLLLSFVVAVVATDNDDTCAQQQVPARQLFGVSASVLMRACVRESRSSLKCVARACKRDRIEPN